VRDYFTVQGICIILLYFYIFDNNELIYYYYNDYYAVNARLKIKCNENNKEIKLYIKKTEKKTIKREQEFRDDSLFFYIIS